MTTVEEIIIKIRADVAKASKELSSVNKRFQKGSAHAKTYAKAQEKVVQSQLRLKRAMGETPFAGWAMSIMFAGMAMKRVFDTIWKSASKTFTEVMKSTGDTSTGFDMLSGSLKYLGFTMGAALEPVATALIPIIDSISQFITDYPKLSAGIAVSVGAVGAIAMFAGMFKLAWNGIKDAFAKLGLAIPGLGAKIKGLGTTIRGSLGTIGVAIAAAVAIWIADVGGIKDAVKNIFGGLWQTVKASFTHIKEIMSSIWGAIIALLSGDIDSFLEHTKNAVKHIMALSLKVITGVATAIVNALIWVVNFLTDSLFTSMTNLMKLAKKVAEALGLDNAAAKYQNMIDKALEFQEKITIGYITNTDEVFKNIDQTVGLGENSGTTVVIQNMDVRTDDAGYLVSEIQRAYVG